MATGSESTALTEEYEEARSDVELLNRAWRNEKAAPEILNFETSLVRRIKEQIELAEQNVEDYEENGIDPLTVSLYQMDLDRTRFLFRSYLRVRLHKIEKYLFHISTNEDSRSRLSREELEFVQSCEDGLGNHLREAVLSKLPENYRDKLRQSITSEDPDMVPAPRLDSFVICKARQYLSSMDFEPEYSLEIAEMERDLPTFICYKFIKKPFEQGKIDLV